MLRYQGATIVAALGLMLTQPCKANDWEKFYRPVTPVGPVQPWTEGAPETLPASGSIEQEMDALWSQGFAPIGFTAFNSSNSQTKDAMRLAAKLKARYVIVFTQLTSSQTVELPLTTPTTSTSQTNGTVNVFGMGGSATGTYTGTTTTYGSRTTFIPILRNRYDKVAVFYQPVAARGTGVLPRPLTQQEVARFETQRAFVIRAVRQGSPAYEANLLPGDVVLYVNGKPADFPTWNSEIPAANGGPVKLSVMRNGQAREIVLTVPPEWR